MSFISDIKKAIAVNNSMVCVGLDPAFNKLPEKFQKCDKAFFEFNRFIIDATHDLVCCYKPQAAYYAGADRDDELKMTIDYIHDKYPGIPVILDVKRGDIGSTAEQYAKEAFERYDADAVTVNPYMGFDAVKPFLDYQDKGVIILCRTSNPNSGDLQNLVSDGMPLYQHVAKLVRDKWNYNGNAALVVGATYPDELSILRDMCPELPFLVPGVGAQGGSVEAVVSRGAKNGAILMINSSRGIIYNASPREAAEKLRAEINLYR